MFSTEALAARLSTRPKKACIAWEALLVNTQPLEPR
jgi:hypothetical protein